MFWPFHSLSSKNNIWIDLESLGKGMDFPWMLLKTVPLNKDLVTGTAGSPLSTLSPSNKWLYIPKSHMLHRSLLIWPLPEPPVSAPSLSPESASSQFLDCDKLLLTSPLFHKPFCPSLCIFVTPFRDQLKRGFLKQAFPDPSDCIKSFSHTITQHPALLYHSTLFRAT